MRLRWVALLASGFMALSLFETAFDRDPALLQTNTPPAPAVIVGSPQPGEDWPLGTSQLIRWSTRELPTPPEKQSDVRVKIDLLGQGGRQDIRRDDGVVDLNFERGDTILVARLTPPSYPATLEEILVLAPPIGGQSDRQKDVTLYFFADQDGREQPPMVRGFQTRAATIRSTGSFERIRVTNGPTLTRSPGVFYIGYELVAPTSGFAFPIDRNNERRTFIADSRGSTFREAQFTDQNGAPLQGNLMVRAAVTVPETVTPIAEDLENTGQFCWRVQLEGQAMMTGAERRPARIKVSVQLPDQPTPIEGESESFTISEALQSITVTSPASGDVWRMKEERIIRWDAVGLVGDVRIELVSVPSFESEPLQVICLFDGENVNAEQRSWEVSAPRPGFYRIKVSSSLDFRVFDESDVFVILGRENSATNQAILLESQLQPASFWRSAPMPPASCTGCGYAGRTSAQPPPWITVVSPNGGEVFEPGDRLRITWGSQGVRGNVRIVLFDLTQDPRNPQPIRIRELDNTGVFEWTAPARLSDQLKIGVMSVDDPSVADVSDGVFTVGIPGQGEIRIVMPNGGEEFEMGTETRIMWTTRGSDVGDKVRLDISFDGGISFQPLCPTALCTEVTNNGDYRWGIHLPPSENVRLRIVSKRRPWISDVTNCSFRIIPPRPPDPNAPRCPPPRR